VSPNPGRRRIGRVVLAVTSALVLVATVAAAGTNVLIGSLAGNITAVDISENVSSNTGSGDAGSLSQTDTDTGTYQPLNIALIGSDTRSGDGNSGAHLGNANQFGGGRSDTVILLHISGDRKSAIGVSIPRDTMITLPQCKNKGKSVGGYEARFNVAYEIGGPGCTIKALEQISGLPINNFLEVDFGGFKNIVDAVGGVDVCLATDVNDKKSGLKLTAGNHTIKGDEALAFVRVRHGISDGSDTSRIRRQQAFISSLMRKVLSSGTLLNPAELLSVLTAATQSLTADPQLADVTNLKDLAISLKDLKPNNVTFTTVPWLSNADRATLRVNTKRAQPIWDAMKNDTAFPTKGDSETVLTVDPSKIRVNVLNGTATKGLAKQVAKALKAEGFRIQDSSTADSTTYTETTVQYDPAYDKSAATLAAATNAAKLEAVPDQGAALTLILGSDWVAVQPVKISKLATDYTTKINTGDENFCAQ